MSLPSQAQFYGESGNLIGDCFVNVGWFVDVLSLKRVIFHELPKQVYTDTRISYCVLYGWKIPIEFIQDLLPLDHQEQIHLLNLFFNNPKNYIES